MGVRGVVRGPEVTAWWTEVWVLICDGEIFTDLSETWVVDTMVDEIGVGGFSGVNWLESLDVKAMWSSSVNLNSSRSRDISIPMRA